MRFSIEISLLSRSCWKLHSISCPRVFRLKNIFSWALNWFSSGSHILRHAPLTYLKGVWIDRMTLWSYRLGDCFWLTHLDAWKVRSGIQLFDLWSFTWLSSHSMLGVGWKAVWGACFSLPKQRQHCGGSRASQVARNRLVRVLFEPLRGAAELWKVGSVPQKPKWPLLHCPCVFFVCFFETWDLETGHPGSHIHQTHNKKRWKINDGMFILFKRRVGPLKDQAPQQVCPMPIAFASLKRMRTEQGCWRAGLLPLDMNFCCVFGLWRI